MNRLTLLVSSHISLLKISLNKSTYRTQTPPRPLHCRPLVTEYMSYKMPYLIRLLWCRPLVSVKKNDRRSTSGSGSTPKFNLFLRVTPCHAYHVWSTSVKAFVSYPADRQTEWQNEQLHDPANLGSIIKMMSVEFLCVNMSV